MHPENLTRSLYQPGRGMHSRRTACYRRIRKKLVRAALILLGFSAAFTIAALAAWPGGPVLIAVTMAAWLYGHTCRTAHKRRL